MYRKKKRHRNKKGRSGAINQYGVISSSQSIYDPIPKGKKNKKAKKLTILGLEPKLFEALCESVPLRHDITIFDIKYR